MSPGGHRPSRATHAAVGGVCGLAWAASLRSYMAEINGAGSAVEWAGTFIGILLPGVIVGAALGVAVCVRVDEPAGRVALRWCAAAPLAFAVFPMLLPDQLVALLTTGLGGGAVGVALGAIAGGYAIGGRRRWLRVGCAVAALVLIAGVVASVPLIGGRPLAATAPRGVWVMLLAASLLVVLMFAAAIPFRRLGAGRGGARRATERRSTRARHRGPVPM